MNTRQIEYFLAVADELSFTRAARRLYVSQTAVTQQIKALEEQLGVQLFERTKKKVVLTPAGIIFQGEPGASPSCGCHYGESKTDIHGSHRNGEYWLCCWRGKHGTGGTA